MSIRSVFETRAALGRGVIAVLAGIVLSLPVAFADPPSDKGKGGSSASHGKGGQSDGYQADDDGGPGKGKGKGKTNDQNKGRNDDRDGQGKDGQQVAECNHRANDQKLKGQERKEYVEWCTDRGARDNYDTRRFETDRSCYRDADARGLDGDFRRVAVQECLGREDAKRQKRK